MRPLVRFFQAVVNNPDSPPFITFISTTSKMILGKVVFDGTGGTPNATNGAEQCQWNQRNGKIYLSIPKINGSGDNSAPGGVVVFNPTTQAILRVMTIPLSACTGPQGLAIGPEPQIGLGCSSSPTASKSASPQRATADAWHLLVMAGGLIAGIVFARVRVSEELANRLRIKEYEIEGSLGRAFEHMVRVVVNAGAGTGG